MHGASGSTGLPVFLAPSVADGRLILDGEEARHAASARRVQAGEQVALSDGAGTMARCVVESVRTGKSPELSLEVRERYYVERPALRVTIAQALVKGERGELAVELATEAGADAVLPWRAARSIARWDDGPRGAKALQRWRRTAQSAAKQSRRAWVPEVREPVDTEGLATVVREVACAAVLNAEAGQPFAELPLPGEGELVVVVGPEGGINDTELAALRTAGAIPARLGPTVLRASSAAAVTLGAIGARTGRWS